MEKLDATQNHGNCAAPSAYVAGPPAVAHEFVVTSSFVDGNPSGLRIVSMFNWTGRAILFPRELLQELNEKKKNIPELNAKSAVYMLLGEIYPDNAPIPCVYFGESYDWESRFTPHLKDGRKDFWQNTVVFSTYGDPLNKAQIQYLEYRLIKLAEDVGHYRVMNSTTPSEPPLSYSDKININQYLRNMLLVMPAVGIDVFSKPSFTHQIAATSEKPDEEFVFSSKAKEWDARGYPTTKGFVVLAGSKARKTTVVSSETLPFIALTRDKMLQQRVLREEGNYYVFSRDYEFNSPSQAAYVCSGSNQNGRDVWRKGNKSLNEIEAEAEKIQATDDSALI